jgi:hypothetical protein
MPVIPAVWESSKEDHWPCQPGENARPYPENIWNKNELGAHTFYVGVIEYLWDTARADQGSGFSVDF